jgi:hypothetical protein
MRYNIYLNSKVLRIMRVQTPPSCAQKIVAEHGNILTAISLAAIVAIVALSVLSVTGHINSNHFAIGCLGASTALFTTAAIGLTGRKLCTSRLHQYGLLAMTALVLSLLPVLVLTRQLQPISLASANLTAIALTLSGYCIIKGIIKRR